MRPAWLSAILRMATVAAVLPSMLTATAPPAAAHTDLTAAMPQPGAEVTQLDTIRLQFYGPLQRDVQHAIQLLDPGGGRWDNAQTQMVPDRARLVGIAPTLARQGEYTVRWCTLTPDGHAQPGAYVFSYTGPTSPPTPPPTTADAAADCPAAATRGRTALPGWPITGLLAALMLFLITTALLNRHARQRPS